MNKLFCLFTFIVLTSCGQITNDGAKVTKLASGFKFTEGPAADSRGHVYFTDIPNSKIHKWNTDTQTLSTFRENTHRTNGLYFDDFNNLYTCQSGKKRVLMIKVDGATEVLTSTYNNKPYNQPNDLWIDPKGGIYFTDPNYSRKPLTQDGMHVYYIHPDSKEVTRVADDYQKPNGIIGSKDGKLLYIADNKGKKTYSYHINNDGSLSHKRLFCARGSDGMTLDEKGNLYVTTDAVYVFSPDGQQIKKIAIPERPTNVCFGGKENQTLYITARKSLYSLEMSVKGQ